NLTMIQVLLYLSSSRRHTSFSRDWSSDVCSSDLPGDEHFRNRYQMLGEYAHILRELWETGVSDFKGEYYQMDDCRVRPMPEGEIDRKSTRLNSSHVKISYAVFCLKKKIRKCITQT